MVRTRRRSTAPLLLALWVAITTLSASHGAAAAPAPQGSAGIEIRGTSIVVDAAATSEGVRRVDRPRPADPARTIHCVFLDVPGFDTPIDGLRIARRPVARMLYQLWCWRGADSTTAVAGTPRLVVHDPRDPVPLPGLVDAWDLTREAARRLDLPRPTIVLSPAADQLVGVDTWLAATGPLHPDPVTAAVTLQAGTVWSTAIPTFSHVDWDLGDGSHLRCTDPVDRVFDPRRPDAAPPTCRHLYQTAAPARTITATATWAVSWRSSADPVTRPFGTVSRSNEVTVAVVELQSLIR